VRLIPGALQAGVTNASVWYPGSEMHR
jgi:hypothetical protein